MRPRDQFDDAEAEADAGGGAGEPLIDAVEALENAPVFARRDPDAVVLYVEGDALRRARRPHQYALLIRRVLQRVVEQIDQRGDRSAFISANRRKIRRYLQRQLAIRRDTFPDRGHRSIHDRGGSNRREREPLAAALEAREGQEVLDQAREPRVLAGKQ